MALFYSVVVVFSKDRKQILLGKRREDKLWTSPAGGGEEGETPEDTAVRELYEETNIKCNHCDLLHLTSVKAHNDKPIFVYIYQLRGKQEIHVRNDPDKEVPSWKWFPLNSMPKLDENRLKTTNMAKMKMMDLVKSIVSNDMFTGTDIYTQDYSQDDMAARNSGFFEYLSQCVESCVMHQPMDVALGEGTEMTIEKIAEGMYSGSVKNPSGERMMNFAELTIPSLVQALKAKQIIKDVPEEHVEKEEVQIIEEDSSANPLNAVIEALRNVKVQGDLNININKSVKDFVQLLKKGRGKADPIGTVRTYANGQTMKKMANGKWETVSSKKKNSAEDSKKDKIEKLKADHAKKLKELQDAHDKELAGIQSKGANVEEKRKGPEKEPKSSEEGKGPDKEEAKEATTGTGTAEGAGNGSSEGSEGVSGEDEKPQEESPREEAPGLIEQTDEYINARKSTVTNLGADLLDSARHKAAWRTAEEAEA